MRSLALISVFLILVGCTNVVKTLENIRRTTDDISDVLDTTKKGVDAVEAKIRQADTDGDGSLSWAEILAALGITSGVGTALVARNKVSNAVKEKNYAQINARLDSVERSIIE